MYADLGFKNSDVEFHAELYWCRQFLRRRAASPVQLLDLGWNKAFTTPQTTVNKMTMESLNGTVKATDTLSFSGVTYIRSFSQFHQDGNPTEAAPCGPGPGLASSASARRGARPNWQSNPNAL